MSGSLWGILSKLAKKKTANQESDSKRWMINETDNYSTSSEPTTPSSGDPTIPTDSPKIKARDMGVNSAAMFLLLYVM